MELYTEDAIEHGPSLERGDLLLILLLTGADYDVSMFLLQPTYGLTVPSHRWGSQDVLWTLLVGWLNMGSEGLSSRPQPRAYLSNSWISMPSGAMTYFKCWRGTRSVILDEAIMISRVSLMRSTPTFQIPPSLQHIYYL